jgi:peptidyl-Asp metalloendopeptidase
MTPTSRSLATALLVVFPSLYGCGGDVREEAPEGAETAVLLGPGDAVAPWDPSVLRARRAHVLLDVTSGERSPFAAKSPRRVALDLFDDARYEAELVAVEPGASGFTWIGAFDDGAAALGVSDGAYAATIRAGSQLFQIARIAGDEHLVIERDETRAANEIQPIEADLPDAGAPPAAEWSGDTSSATRVDVLVAYTAAARIGAGGEAGMAALVDLAVAEANQSYGKSGVPLDLHLVGAVETTYDETAFDWQQTLGRLRTQGDGFMDELHALRDEAGADHVVLLVESATTYAGLGYQLTQPAAPFFASWAFSVVSRSYATGFYTFAHELGHNMGAQHDEAHAAGPGYHLYSHGLQQPAAAFRTVMAYACDGSSCPRVDQWSSPLVLVGGVPTGIDGVADNAKTLGITAPIVAAFRPTTEAPPPIAAIVSPPDGSTLPAGDVTFVFSDAGAESYVLDIGDAPGGDEHYAGDASAALEATVTGLPEDGRTLHARLWSLDSTGTWRYRDHTYTAFSAVDYRAHIEAPAPGSTLDSTLVTFGWQPSGAQAYRLEVGTAADPTRFFAADLGTATAAFVIGLPHTGDAVHARLGSLGPSGWLWDEVDYAGYQAPPYAATLTQPAPGSTLPSAAVTFRWTTTDASEHRLLLHDAAGRVFRGDPGPFDGMLVTDLPQDGGRVVATVLSLGPEGWASTSTVYRAASP